MKPCTPLIIHGEYGIERGVTVLFPPYFEKAFPTLQKTIPHTLILTRHLRKTTFEMFQNVSNVVSAFRGHWFTAIYKGDFGGVSGGGLHRSGMNRKWIVDEYPHLGRPVCAHTKNASACVATHIGHEENYIWDVLKRLKCNFALPQALIYSDIQRRFSGRFRGRIAP